MSTRDPPGGKGGRCVRLTTYHPCSAKRQEIRDLNLPGPPWAISKGCCERAFTFTITFTISSSQQCSYCRTRVASIPQCFPTCRSVFSFYPHIRVTTWKWITRKITRKIVAYETVTVLCCPATLRSMKGRLQRTNQAVVRRDLLRHCVLGKDSSVKIISKKKLTINSKLCLFSSNLVQNFQSESVCM